MKMIAPGIWKLRLGEPEKLTPVNMREDEIFLKGFNKLPDQNTAPFNTSDVDFAVTKRGCVVELPLTSEEKIYGFGLQLKSVNQTKKKKHLRVNADPIGDTGDTHAPVPFYASTAGYGVFVDTARYVTFNCGNSRKRGKLNKGAADEASNSALDNIFDFYASGSHTSDTKMVIEIPCVEGVDIYIFAGPDMRTAVQRYNLFSGGGCMPALWGLGIWYRPDCTFNGDQMLEQAKSFRDNNMPFDVYGPEPSWHSHSYSCSYKWDEKRIPDHEKFIAELNNMNYKINLWEHAFVHPTSPIYDDLKPYSGDYEVWNGLVPDFYLDEARKIFAEYHRKELVDKGIAGFKLDECDGSDYTGGWSFPNCTQFPSGLDGEQMHNMLGILYQRTIMSVFKNLNQRTLNQVRASYALASPLPFILYSDLYNHQDYIRGVVNMGFSGLLWSPEVRWCSSVEDLIRRVQTVVFSPHALINVFEMPNAPWLQYDNQKNKKGELLENYKEVEDMCRKLFELRMSLIPYLYSSFAQYHFDGKPPFRALVMDYPGDSNTFDIDNQYMMGDSLLVAPVVSGQAKRKVYLPEGNWYCFWTGKKYSGGQYYDVEPELEKIPVYVKEGAMLPLAKPVQYITPDTSFEITVRCYGENYEGFTLFEDNGHTYDFENGEYNLIKLNIGLDGKLQANRSGNYKGEKYRIFGQEIIK